MSMLKRHNNFLLRSRQADLYHNPEYYSFIYFPQEKVNSSKQDIFCSIPMILQRVSNTFSASCFLLQCFGENDPYVCQDKSQPFASQARTNHSQILTAKSSVTHVFTTSHTFKMQAAEDNSQLLFHLFYSPDRNSTDAAKGPADCPCFFSVAAGTNSYPETQQAIKPCAVSNK